MISGANMELYIQLLRQYTACPVHPVHAKTTGENPTDGEPQIPTPPAIITPDDLPDTPPEPKGIPDVSPTPDGIIVVPPDEDEDKEGEEDEL